MKRLGRSAILCLALLGLLAPPADAQFQIALDEIAAGLDRPTGVNHAGDGSGRLFVVEQFGTIRIVDANDQLLPTPFLTIDGVFCCSERGLLGLAFHPNYEANGRFFVHYINQAGNSVFARFEVSTFDPNRADPNSEVVILTVDQPAGNHNGGQIAFGPDGYLYVALGDGGGAGDQFGNGQNLDTLLGSMLRLDVDSGATYTVPPDNPFVGVAGARDEIWAYGLRNPWRFSFDRETGDLFIADVGQADYEEIHFIAAGSPGGQNFGWNRMEGFDCYPPGPGSEDSCNVLEYQLPILSYNHDVGCSVTGGYRYRGPASPLSGLYVFGDFCSGRVWAAQESKSPGWRPRQVAVLPFNISTFGEDEAGRLYVVEYAGEASKLHRLRTVGAAQRALRSGSAPKPVVPIVPMIRH